MGLIALALPVGCGPSGPSTLMEAASARATLLLTSWNDGTVTMSIDPDGDPSPSTCPELGSVRVTQDGAPMSVLQAGGYSDPSNSFFFTAGPTCMPWQWIAFAPAPSEASTTLQLEDSSATWTVIAQNLGAPRSVSLVEPGPQEGGSDVALRWSPGTDTYSGGSLDMAGLSYPDGGFVYRFADGGSWEGAGAFVFDAGVMTTWVPPAAAGAYDVWVQASMSPGLTECSGPPSCQGSIEPSVLSVPITLEQP